MGKDTWKPSRSVAGEALGKRGAPALASFLNGIDAAREDDPHLTAMGHSYGSFTTGLALQRRTGVDDAVFYGSPGIGTSDADDVLVPDGHKFVIEADRDPVADFARFGIDPNQMDGMRTLSADEKTRSDGSVLRGSKGHSEYTAGDTTSQYNLSRVIAGLEDDRFYGDGYGAGDVLQTPLPSWLR